MINLGWLLSLTTLNSEKWLPGGGSLTLGCMGHISSQGSNHV